MGKVWVTGAAGFLGRNLCRYIKNNGSEVFAMGMGLPDPADVEAYSIDSYLSAPLTIDALKKLKHDHGTPDAIYHTAGGSSVGLSIEDPYGEFQKTVLSTLELLEFIRNDAPMAALVYPSSAAVYGAVNRGEIKVDTPLNPVSPYGTHKELCEMLISSYTSRFHLKATIVRFFSLYGPGLRKQLLWDLSAKFSLEPEEIELHGTGEEERDWIYIDDAVELMTMAAERASSVPEILNGGTGTGVQIKEIAMMVKEAFKSKAEIRFSGNEREGDPKYYHADISGAKKCGWKEKIELADGIKRYVDWYKEEELTG
jgi:UDP-glucose 4-epimerase